VVDAQANIRVNLDSGQALAELKALEKQIQFFNKSIIQGSAEAARIQNEFSSSLIHNINATGKFTASMGKVHTETERFTNALEKNKLSAREYFRYSMASTKSFGKLFGKEFGTITKVAEERVKLLQTRHIELGRAADGAMRAVKIVPNSLDYSKPITQMQLAIQKQQIFNKLLDAGTTKLLNFGKNTQWAGRQLMVGFTIPLTILGSTAIRTFKDMETQAIRFKKVYGDIFTTTGETNAALESIKKLAVEYTKYGVSITDTIKMAADAAAAGNSGAQLESVVSQATKLSVLGGVAQDQALEATIAIQNAFGATGKELDKTINFLNAVENQTVVALDDITQAIPKVAPVIQQLGGDIRDLAVFMAAMQEGGVKASEAANALKSGLASLINPTRAASEMAAELGINLKGIVEQNAGDLKATVMTFATALQPLDDLAKARLIETIFGKYQFARLSTLFENVAKSGTQASRVMQLATSSTEELGIMAERELGLTANSAAVKFQASVEKLKAALVPLGQAFAETLTPIIDFATKALDKFNSFSDGTKKGIVTLIAVIGGIGPVLLMSIGLIANGIANIGKGINLVRRGYQSLTSGGQELGLSTQYLSSEQLEALSVANNLHNVHEILTDQFALEATALANLTTVYRQANAAATAFASSNPQFFAQGAAGKLQNPKFGKRMAKGGWVPGTGNKDSVPTVLMPGEFVVNKKAAQSNSQTLESMNKGGQVYRSQGTPAFGNFVGRSKGSVSRQTDSVSLVGHLQTSGLHLRQGTKKDNGAYRYAGYTMLGNQSFNQLTQNRAADIRPIMGGSDVEGYPMFRKEAKDIASLIRTKKDLTINEKVALKVLEAELKQFPSDRAWQGEMSRRYALNAVAAEGLDPTSPQAKALMKELDDSFKKASSSSRNSNQLTERLYANADDLWARGVLGDKGMGVKAKMLPHKTYRGMPLVQLLGMLNDPNLVRAQGKYGLTVPKFLNPKYDNAGNLVSVLDMPMKKQTAGVRTTSPSLGSRARSASQKPSLKFGALAALGATAIGTAAQAAQRQTGTPSYGEQGVTPAMLTPGEFVVNSKSAQKFGPQLQGMNQGGMVYRADPSGPGYDFKVTDRRSSAQGINTTSSQSSASRSSMRESLSSATSTIGGAGKKVAERLITALGKNETVVDKNTKILDNGIKQSGRIAARQRMSRGANTAGMIGFGISGAAMAVGMMSKDEKTQQLANNISFASGTIGSLAMAIPMLMNPLVAMTTALIGIPASLYLMKKSIDNARKNGYEFAQSMSNTSKDLEAMGEMTGNISRSEIAQRQKQSRLSPINPLKSDFGDTFITSDLGKKLLSQTSELTKNNFGATSAEIIGSKLADYVVEGLVDPAQAQSIAEAIGFSLGSEDIALNINGKLQEIIGINGNDLYKDPLEVRIRLIQESTAINQDFVNSIETQLSKVDAEQIWSDSGFYNFSGIGSSLGKAIRGEERDLLKLGDLLLGTNMFKDRQVAKLAGQQLGYNQSLLQTSQKALDTYNSQTDVKRQEFIEQEKILRNAISNTKNAKDQITLQDNLNRLIRDRNVFEEKYQDGRVEIVNQQKQSLDFVMKTFNANKKLQGQMLKASSEAVTGTYKGTPLEGVAGAFAAQAEQFKDKEVTFLINTQVASGNIGLEAAMSLISIMTGKDGKLNEEGIQKQITLYAEAKGIGVEGLDRILSATTEVQDRFKRGETINLFRDLKPEAFDRATSFLETATNLSNKDVDLTAVVDTLSIDQMVAAGEDIAKINKEIPDKVTKEALIKFAQSDTDFAGIETNVEWFDSLPDEQTKLAIQVYRTVFETIDADKVRQDLMARNAGQNSSSLVRGGVPLNVTDEEVVAETARRAVDITKKYFGPGSIYTKGIADLDTDTSGGAGGSTKALTTQLIQLRMKGLDPAALATLDKASADKILNGTTKQQKSAIAALNAELRDQAIQLEVLKSDQEVLQDTMGATTDAISSYIDMLQQTRINPIQDQIDQYNELSNAQQKQMDLYGRGLQQLSDKEDNINKLYDDRISAIDKVTQANDRALQRQQNQIDLASAIASGDFGAAASAAANISNTEAQAQLEDARTALEQQRQSELKALTIEVNGQLYTREQIETNIKNIEESIYQTSLLVRQEQEKIAVIEKTITAEKEKQRKLQVLTQMSQLSTQMQTTVNQSARQAMGAQLGYLGQSIGLNPNDPTSIAATSQSLGINVQALADSILRSQQIATLTATEFAIEAEKAKKKAGDLSRFYGEASVEGKNSLAYLTTLNTAWAGDSKKSGLGGMVSTGRDILSSLSQSADAIRIGKNQIQNSVDSALASIRSARRPFAMGGSVKRMAMGGNVNYKGSTEPAPVRMAVGNLVPGLGNTDRVPALLTPGEFVVRKSVTKENLGLLKALNGDVFPQMSAGIGANAVMVPITNTNMEGSTTLYNNNYSVNVNVAGTTSTADEVANVVIRKIKGMNDRGIRGNRY
jgi:hypothetical protein